MEETSKTNILLYPNPSNDYFSINGVSISEIRRINIYSFDGRLVNAISDPKENKVDISEFAAGLYFVNLQSKVQLFREIISIIR